MTCTVTFEPSGTAVEIEQGLTLLDAARAADIPLEATCGGRGTCGKCQVRIAGGPQPPVGVRDSAALSGAAIEEGWRLACQCVVTSPVTVETFRVRARAKGEAVPLPHGFILSPPVRRWAVDVPAATLQKPMDDAGSLCQALERAGAGPVDRIDLPAAREVPTALRAAAGAVSATVRGGELVGVRPGGGARQDPALGIAIDLGTTNLAAYLYRMDNGDLLEVLGAANPLSSYGADIVTRLAHAARAPAHGQALQRVLVKAVNMLCRQAAREQGAANVDIEEMVVVGNSGMHHLFLDLPGGQLTRSPFVPAARAGMSIKARDLGIEIGAGAYVFMPPLVGGFVGSDLLAVALSARMAQGSGVRLALDIGTNTELLLTVDGVLHCCSTASGPALGAALRYGTVAVPGAIDRMWTGGGADVLQFSTVEKRPATGICGSGIVDALGCLLRLGDISRNGRLRADSPRVRPQTDGDHRCVLAAAAQTALGADLTISQREVRSLQLAKGAIRAGIETLLTLHGLEAGQLDEILIAGTFGNHLHIESAVEIGLLPRVPLERIRQIGNAAGLGAGLMLLSEKERAAADQLSRSITHVELSLQEGFRRRFAHAQWFPEELS